MRLRYAYFIICLLSIGIAADFFPSFAQENYEYSLSIEEYLNNALSPQEGRNIKYDEVTGILAVTDTPSNHKLIKRLIKQFDEGPRQVMIEAKFVEIGFDDLDELGIEWYYRHNGDVQINETSATRLLNPPNTGETGGGNPPNRQNKYIYNEDYQGIQWDTDADNPFPISDFGWGFIMSQYESGRFLTAYLKALASEGRANLLSSPKITTLSGQMANIQVTQTFPYVSAVDFENTGTAEHPIWQFKYTLTERITGITLEVTPYVGGGSDIITLDIHPEVSNLVDRRPIFVGADAEHPNPFTTGADVPALLGWPVVDTRTAQTSVTVQSGETVVMGGFVKDDDAVTKKKIPLLGDIPVIGKLFNYEYKSRSKKNLVIFLTATLITAEGETVQGNN